MAAHMDPELLVILYETDITPVDEADIADIARYAAQWGPHTERTRAHPLPGTDTAATQAEDGGWPEVLRARLARYPPHLDRRPAPLGLSRQGTHTAGDTVFRGALATEWPRSSGLTTGPRSNVITAATGAAIRGTREQRWVELRRAELERRRLAAERHEQRWLESRRARRAELERRRLAAERGEEREDQP